MTFWNPRAERVDPVLSSAPATVSVRTLGFALEETLMGYTRRDLEVVLADELKIEWPHADTAPDDVAYSKREVIQAYTKGWELPRLIGLARRVVAELDVNSDRLGPLLAEYDKGGGVGTPAKNLIFAANGPKPELVLRDAVNNDIEIVRNGEHCLVFDQPVPADGLRFTHLISWWRERENIPADVTDHEVGRALHARLRASLGDNGAELKVFDSYATRYRASLGIPALIPQVYLHYDPQTQHRRRRSGEEGPLARQRMDFLILFSSRHRVVLEVDGRQHYADGDIASPSLYAQMVAEDRRLRLNGYEVYRFGGAELAGPGAEAMLSDFFDQLTAKMS